MQNFSMGPFMMNNSSDTLIQLCRTIELDRARLRLVWHRMQKTQLVIASGLSAYTETLSLLHQCGTTRATYGQPSDDAVDRR
jgi:hypothetical protein